MSTERCEREGLTPDGDALVVDCAAHGAVGRIPAGHREAERGDKLFAQHAATERDKRLREARGFVSTYRTMGSPTAPMRALLALDEEVTRLAVALDRQKKIAAAFRDANTTFATYRSSEVQAWKTAFLGLAESDEALTVACGLTDGNDMEAHASSFNEGYETAVTQGLADDPTRAEEWLADHDERVRRAALAAAQPADDLALWPRIEQAVYATTVSRSAIDATWPECHRKNCQHQHASPDEAFGIFAKQIADSIRTELLCRATSDPDHGDELPTPRPSR